MLKSELCKEIYSGEKVPRNGLIDIYRFLASIIIVIDHMGSLGLSEFPFWRKGDHVIFFFMLTGYVTMQHFSKNDDDIIQYTFHKFKKFIPYTFFSCLIGLILMGLRGGGRGTIIRILFSPIEIMLLGDLIPTNYSPIDPPLWTLSSTLIVFPVICFLVKRMKEDRRYLWISGYISVIGSFCWGIVENAGYPFTFLRAFFTILVGCVIFFATKEINKISLTIVRYIVPIIAVVAFGLSVVICYRRLDLLDLFTILCAASIMCSMSSYGNVLKGNIITDWLGKISMIIYIVHYQGIWVVTRFFDRSDIDCKIIVYCVSVMILTLTAYFFIEIIMKNFKAWKRATINEV